MRSPASRSTSSVASASTASGGAPSTMLRDSRRRGSAPACAIIAGGGDSEKENRAADIVHDETVELAEHSVQRGASAQLRHHFGVDAVGDERRADAVAGNIADEQIQIVIVERTHQPEIAADGANGVIESFDSHSAPDE